LTPSIGVRAWHRKDNPLRLGSTHPSFRRAPHRDIANARAEA
jgi:hypothetical protein